MLARSPFASTQTLTKYFREDEYPLHFGDTIILECHHSTKNMNVPIYGGISSSNELCLALITHYCPENQICPLSKLTSCFSWPTEESLSKVFDFELRLTPEVKRYLPFFLSLLFLSFFLCKKLREVNY